MKLPLVTIEVSDTVRLIPTAYYKPPVLKALVDTEEDLAILEEIEGLTNRRLRIETSGTKELEPRELVYNAWGQSFINAAFAYTRPEGNRFNGPDRGAWYCAFEELTAIDEVAYHRTRELIRINRFEDEAIYQSILAGFMGEFHDLRQRKRAHASLHAEPSKGYPVGQKLARTLRDGGSRGLVYQSVRRPGYDCLVAFEPHLVQNVRPAAKWKLTWDGSADYTVTTV